MGLKQWKLDLERRCGGYAIVTPDGREVAMATQRDAHPRLGQGITDAEALANGRLIAAAPQIADALRKADAIIKVMLAALTPEQAMRVHAQLDATDLSGEGMTQHNERAAILAAAGAA